MGKFSCLKIALDLNHFSSIWKISFLKTSFENFYSRITAKFATEVDSDWSFFFNFKFQMHQIENISTISCRKGSQNCKKSKEKIVINVTPIRISSVQPFTVSTFSNYIAIKINHNNLTLKSITLQSKLSFSVETCRKVYWVWFQKALQTTE